MVRTALIDRPLSEMRKQDLKSVLSDEWNKPKEKNLRIARRGPNIGEVIDPREPRNYELIEAVQAELNQRK